MNQIILDTLTFCCDEVFGFVLVDDEKNIIKQNYTASFIFGEFDNLDKIEHKFNFDICILNNDDLMKYNPLSAAFESNENFTCEAVYQQSENEYKYILIKSLNLDHKKLIIFNDRTEKQANKNLKLRDLELSQIVETLTKQNEDNNFLKQRAETQAVRTALVNKVSDSIRDTLDIKIIINNILKEVANTLATQTCVFAYYNKESNIFETESVFTKLPDSRLDGQIASDKDIILLQNELKSVNSLCYDLSVVNHNKAEKILKPRLITPVVYRDELIGMLILYLPNKTRQWHKEEINLVEGIASQLASAINQARLFQDIENQKTKLEDALLKLKQAQSQLVQSEKMASLGQLVAGVAHEINTPLGAINSNNSLLTKLVAKSKSDSKDVALSIVENINSVNTEAINRITNIVKSLKNFARLDETDQKSVDIHEGINSTLALIEHQTKNKIKIIKNYADLPEILCYPNLLNQVFMNILVNACQSVDKNGKIEIKTEQDASSVQISIKDNGKGIAQENLAKIFDPGFTTKGVGVGTGLGLSISHQIVQKHNGSISVESETDKGTIFTIKLPLV